MVINSQTLTCKRQTNIQHSLTGCKHVDLEDTGVEPTISCMPYRNGDRGGSLHPISIGLLCVLCAHVPFDSRSIGGQPVDSSRAASNLAWRVERRLVNVHSASSPKTTRAFEPTPK